MAKSDRTEFVHPASVRELPTPWVAGPLDSLNFLLNIRTTHVFDRRLDLERLLLGLARVLDGVPHLAGRLAGKKRIAGPLPGVPFRIHEMPRATVQDVRQGRLAADTFSPKLGRGAVQSGRTAPFAVWLTRLADGDVLGVSVSHGLADGRSLYHLIRNWGEACDDRPFPMPVVEASFLPPVKAEKKEEVIARAREAGWHPISPWSLLRLAPAFFTGRLFQRTAPFVFEKEPITALREQLAAETGVRFSTHELVSALVTHACVRAAGHAAGTPCAQAVVFDLRGRLNGLPGEFFGNAAFIAQGARFPAGATVAEIARSQHAQAAPFLERPSRASAEALFLVQATLAHKLAWAPYEFSRMHCRRPTAFYINNFSKMPIYNVNFGTLQDPIRPVRVVPHNLSDPFLIWPAPNGGTEVYLTGELARLGVTIPK